MGRKVSGREEWVTGHREWSREGSTDGDGDSSSPPALEMHYVLAECPPFISFISGS